MMMVIERFRNYGFGNERLGSPLSEEAIELLQLGFDDVRAFLRSRPGKRAVYGRREWKIWMQAFDVSALERASLESGPQMGHKEEQRPVFAAVG
jgi:hypothetical protein